MAKASGRMLPPLTRRQRQVLNFIAAFTTSEGNGPTLDDIRGHLGLAAVSTVHEHVTRLIEKGYVERGWNRARSIVLVPRALDGGMTRVVPLMGTVSAGGCVNMGGGDAEVGVPPDLVRGPGVYALRVRGNTLEPEGIRSGDTLVVEQAGTAGVGRIVVTSVASRQVLARVGGGRKLEPLIANYGKRNEWRAGDVVGVVVGLCRRYR